MVTGERWRCGEWHFPITVHTARFHDESRYLLKMPSLLSDLSYAVRGLRKSPVLAAAAIASLALGIGTNVTVFSVVREMILDDLSARQPDRLARVENLNVSYTLYRELQTAGVFEGLAFHRGLRDRIWLASSRSEMLWIFTTSANFCDVLCIRASAGRLYSQADEGREY